MSDHPRIQKALLLGRMEADRVALRQSEPPRTRSDFRLSPELQPWILPAALFGLSLLRMPPAMKAPLRAFAILMLKRRVSDVVDTARAGVRGTGPGTSRRPTHLPERVSGVSARVEPVATRAASSAKPISARPPQADKPVIRP